MIPKPTTPPKSPYPASAKKFVPFTKEEKKEGTKPVVNVPLKDSIARRLAK